MKITVENDPTTADLWLIGRSGGKAVLAVQVPHDNPRQLALVWRGYMPRWQLQHVTYQIEDLLSKGAGQYVLGTLYAFGSSKHTVGPVANGLYQYLDERSPFRDCDAYRAEFVGTVGKLVLWANVKEAAELEQSLDEVGDNIGIATSVGLFDGLARSIIAETIEKSKELRHETVLRWLTAISRGLDQQKNEKINTAP